MKFQVIFSGYVDPQRDKEKSAQRLAKLVGRPFSAAALAAHDKLVLCTDLTLKEAQQWVLIFRNKAGIESSIEPLEDTLEWTLEPVEERKPQFKCPVCNHIEDFLDEEDDQESHVCSKCSTVAEKYLLQQEKEKLRQRMEAMKKEQKARFKKEIKQQAKQEEIEEIRQELAEEYSEEKIELVRKKKKKPPVLALAGGSILLIAGISYWLFASRLEKPTPEAPPERVVYVKESSIAELKPLKKKTKTIIVKKQELDSRLGQIAADRSLEGKTSDVEKIAKYIEDKNAYASAIGKSALAKAKAGNKIAAEKNFQLAQHVIESIENAPRQYSALGVLAVQYAQAGNEKRARVLFDQARKKASAIEDPVERIRAQTAIATNQATYPPFSKQAQTELKIATIQALRIPETDRKMIALTHIASARARMGQKEEANKLFAEILQKTELAHVTDSIKDNIKRSVILEQMNSGQPVAAISNIKTIKNPGMRDDVILDILEIDASYEQLDDTMLQKQAARIHNIEKRIKAYALIGKHQQQRGHNAAADQSYKTAEALTDEIIDNLARTRNMSFLAKQMVYAGDSEQGQRIYGEIFKFVDLLADGKEKDDLLDTLSRDLADLYLFDQSMDLAEKIDDPKKRQAANQYSLDLLAKTSIIQSYADERSKLDKQ